MNVTEGIVYVYIYIVTVVIIFIIVYGLVVRKEKRDAKKRYQKFQILLETTAAEKLQSSPWLSEQLADILATYDKDIALHLDIKKHPAHKAADAVRLIAKEKRELQKQNNLMRYQLSFYEMLFPWLEEFKEIDTSKGWKLIHEIDGKEESEYDSIREWLSPDEYQRLSQTERYQLVLDRYITK